MRHVSIDPVTGCWEWQGADDTRGYGKFWLEGRSQRAIRVAFWLKTGRWPRRHMVMRHKHCDNPPCVNPAHLKEGLQKTNVADMVRKGRASWQVARARAA